MTARDGYVFVLSAGEYTLERFKKSLGDSLRLANEKGFDKVLVDASGQTQLPAAFDAFEGAQELAARAAGLRIAVVMTDPPTDHRFFEVASRNRGAQIRTFAREDAAHTWLFAEGS